MYPFDFLSHNNMHFSAPHAPPVTAPINAIRYAPPPVPKELHAAATPQPVPRLPAGTFFNSSNPGRLKIARR